MSDALPTKDDLILFMDVESLPAEKTDPLWIKLSATLAPNEGETEEKFEARKEILRRNSALHGPLGRAWMIGFANRKADPMILQSDGTHAGEKKLLLEFYDLVGSLSDPWWVGYNIVGYDIPFLQVRALHHGLPLLARKLGRKTVKPWEQRALDIHQLFPRTQSDKHGWQDFPLRGIAKLDTVCAVLGVQRQSGVMGPGVYEAFLSGNAAGVAEHLRYDVEQVREVFKLLWPIL